MRLFITSTILTLSILSAKPAFMGGFTYKIGGGLESAGATIKILSSGEENKAVISAGASYYPWAKKKYGLDIGAGYNFKKATIITGWDVLQNEPSVSLGFNSELSSDSDQFIDGVQDATCDESETQTDENS